LFVNSFLSSVTDLGSDYLHNIMLMQYTWKHNLYKPWGEIMDFQRRNNVSSPNAHNHAGTPGMPAPQPATTSNTVAKMPESTTLWKSKWLRIALVTLLFSLTVIMLGIIGLFYLGSSKEYKYVNTDVYQAVFLTNDQVYFGHIKALNGNYVDLQDIFYLNNQNTQGTTPAKTTTTNLSLVKLGCEVHGPSDEMIINRSQVNFWENLRSNGQVTTAIKTWIKDNPKGQVCSTTTDSTAQSSSSTATTPPATNTTK